MRSQRKDRPGVTLATQQACRHIAVHDRHLHVHQHHAMVAGQRHLHADLAVFGLVHGHATFFQHQADQFAVFRAVVDHQHPLPGRELPVRLFRRGQPCGFFFHHLAGAQHGRVVQRAAGDGDGKGAALSRHAADYDVAAQRAGKAAADGQAEAGAAKTPGHAGVGLHEGLEYAAQLVGGDADAAVDDVDAV